MMALNKTLEIGKRNGIWIVLVCLILFVNLAVAQTIEEQVDESKVLIENIAVVEKQKGEDTFFVTSPFGSWENTDYQILYNGNCIQILNDNTIVCGNFVVRALLIKDKNFKVKEYLNE